MAHSIKQFERVLYLAQFRITIKEDVVQEDIRTHAGNDDVGVNCEEFGMMGFCRNARLEKKGEVLLGLGGKVGRKISCWVCMLGV